VFQSVNAVAKFSTMGVRKNTPKISKAGIAKLKGCALSTAFNRRLKELISSSPLALQFQQY
jgi:hypothetical protein